jgi:dolichol kinase
VTVGAPASGLPVPGAAITLRQELARKAIHLASTVIPVAYAMGAPRRVVLLVLAVIGAVAVTVEVARFRSARVRALFVRLFGGLLREHEHAAWSGASWLLAAYALSVVLFPRAVAVAAMLAAGFGDASAAIVGRAASAARARRTGVVSRRKTFAGSAACATITAIAAFGIAGVALPSAALAGLFASLAERWDVLRVDDNVRVALAAGIGASLVDVLTTLGMRA